MYKIDGGGSINRSLGQTVKIDLLNPIFFYFLILFTGSERRLVAEILASYVWERICIITNTLPLN